MIHNNANFIFDASSILKYSKTVCEDHLISQIRYTNNYNATLYPSKQNTNVLDMQTKKNTNAFVRMPIDYCKQTKRLNNKIIVILLESPSNDEYNAQGPFGSTAPCWGVTGENIRKNFLPIINSNKNVEQVNGILSPFNNQLFDLVAVNAIRYQCDIGNPGGGNNTRNIFMSLWDNFGFKDDLIERLKKIKPSLIINCCTKEIGKKAKLTALLKENFENKVLECSKHPCVWLTPTGIVLR